MSEKESESVIGGEIGGEVKGEEWRNDEAHISHSNESLLNNLAMWEFSNCIDAVLQQGQGAITVESKGAVNNLGWCKSEDINERWYGGDGEDSDPVRSVVAYFDQEGGWREGDLGKLGPKICEAYELGSNKNKKS